MKCTIEWNGIGSATWEDYFKNLPHSNLLQSADYARGLRAAGEPGKARRALIRIDGQRAGLVQVIETGIISGLVQAVALDRGPLWFKGYGAPEHFAAFFAEFNRQFHPRPGRKRRIIPEAPDDPAVHKALSLQGLKRRNNMAGYQTYRISLEQDLNDIRAAMKKRWRGSLAKAERSDLKITWDWEGQYFPWLAKRYAIDRAQKGYPGPSVELLSGMAKYFGLNKNMLIGRANLLKTPVGAILILCHGSSATYQVGWISAAGKEQAAHHLLLWEALRVLKERGIKDFDLGGINDEHAPGVTTFKEGMGGELVRLAGFYT